MKAGKVRCRECAWKGMNTDILTAQSPFDEEDTLLACPSCKDVNTVVTVCDEDDCWTETSCGTSTKAGYRHTCSRHKPDRY